MVNEDRNLDPSLVEMLDDVILLYHIAVHKQLSKVGKYWEDKIVSYWDQPF